MALHPEKRPGPKYVPNPPGLRYKVILEDAKNAKNNMEFATAQTFESDKVAKDFAALLPLFHFQKIALVTRILTRTQR